MGLPASAWRGASLFLSWWFPAGSLHEKYTCVAPAHDIQVAFTQRCESSFSHCDDRRGSYASQSREYENLLSLESAHAVFTVRPGISREGV